MTEDDAILVCDRLSKRYGTVAALDGVSMRCRPGEVTGLLGVSGSGKSTLLQCLALATVPDSGSVSFGGHRFEFPCSAGRRVNPIKYPEVTMVFQQLFLWPHLSLRENIDLVARHCPCDPDSSAESLCESLGVTKLLDRYPNQVSAGQRQRVAIVRSLQLKARCILLDEITAALDGEQAMHLARILERKRLTGVSIVLASHHLGFTKLCADRFAFLHDGQIRATGSMNEIENVSDEKLRRYLAFA